MQIPWEHLNPNTLRALVEAFITREGTDYGDVEFSLEQKVAQVLGQLQTGAIVITFDPQTETCDLKTIRDASRARRRAEEVEIVYD